MFGLEKLNLGSLLGQKSRPQNRKSVVTSGHTGFTRLAESDVIKFANYKNIIVDDERFAEFKRNLGKHTILPDFYLWERWYHIFDPVSRAVNKITNNSLTSGWTYIDINGRKHPEIADELDNRFDYQNLVPRWFSQTLVHGTSINAKFLSGKNGFRFEIISPSETYNYYYNMNLGKITQFSWRNDIIDYTLVDLYDKQTKEQNFYISRRHSISSLPFGDSYLQPFFVKIDALLRDNDNYRLFLENNSFPGMLIFFDDEMVENPQETMQVLESKMQAWKDNLKRHSGSVVNIKPDDVKIEYIKQDLENKMKLDEKEFIEKSVFSAYQIPQIRMGMEGGAGMNSGKGHEIQQMNFDTDIFYPTAILCQKTWRSWYDKLALPQLEKEGFFEQKGIMVTDADGTERVATAKDFSFQMNKLPVELPSSRKERGIQEVRFGIKSPADYKRSELGASDKDVTRSDEMKLIPNNVTAVLPENMIEGNARRGGITPDALTDAEGNVVGERLRVKGDKDPNNEDEPIPAQEDLPEPEEQKIEEQKAEVDFGLDSKDFREMNLRYKSEQQKFLTKRDLDASQVEQMLETERAKKFEQDLGGKIKEQYESVDFKEVLEEVKPQIEALKKPKQTDPEQNQKASPEHKALKESIRESLQDKVAGLDLNDDILIDTLVFTALLAIKDAERQATEAGQKPIPAEQKAEMEQIIKEYLTARLNALQGDGGEYKPDDELLGFDLPQGLTQSTVEFLTEIVLYAILNSEEVGDDTLQIIQEEIEKRAEERSELVTGTELALIFIIALGLAGRRLGAKAKEWLLSSAARKRQAHLANVGKIIPYDNLFVAGDGIPEWGPGKRIRCQCGLRLVFNEDSINAQS
jgi:hypothetical protein